MILSAPRNFLQNLVARKTIAEQLGDLVKKGLLVVEETQPVLVRFDNGELSVEQSIRLVLKDKEYINKLENENAALQEKLTQMRTLLSGEKDANP